MPRFFNSENTSSSNVGFSNEIAVLGVRHANSAEKASAQASGVREAAMPFSARSESERSACGVRKTPSDLAVFFASRIGSMANLGWNRAEEPTQASTASHSS